MGEAYAHLLHDNPELYNQIMPDAMATMGKFLHSLLERYAPGKRVLDVGCGLGREVHYLATQGYRSAGIDASQAMIKWAQAHYPEQHFYQAWQQNFDLQQQFDAVVCVGSTLLYNQTIEDLIASLRCFQRHLVPGGILICDMRNAAFFLTEVGQQWLKQEHRAETMLPNGMLVSITRFQLALADQMLGRYHTWIFPEQTPIYEHVRHRLIFPQELRLLLQSTGFAIERMFDNPAPHLGSIATTTAFSETLHGRRLQLIARNAAYHEEEVWN